VFSETKIKRFDAIRQIKINNVGFLAFLCLARLIIEQIASDKNVMCKN
jgi:hypothetical protein